MTSLRENGKVKSTTIIKSTTKVKSTTRQTNQGKKNHSDNLRSYSFFSIITLEAAVSIEKSLNIGGWDRGDMEHLRLTECQESCLVPVVPMLLGFYSYLFFLFFSFPSFLSLCKILQAFFPPFFKSDFFSIGLRYNVQNVPLFRPPWILHVF